MKRLLLSTALCAAMLGSACGGAGNQAGDRNTVPPNPGPTTTPTTSATPETEAPPPEPGGDCVELINQMSPRERLAQLLVVGVDPSDPAAVVELVNTHHVGGIFIGGNATDLFTGNSLERVQEAAGDVPVAIAVDDEGGRVQRIDDLVGSLPSAREMARTMTPEEVRRLASERGEELRLRGVTVDFAPVLDLTDGPAGGVIGDRSFSSDPEVATEYALAFAEGLAEAGVQPVVKHFPGHGRADGDSHQELVRTPPLEELRTHDLIPYESIQKFPENTGVMVGHLDVPGLTEGEPASLSPATYELLRDDYSFTGPALTDDLGAMKAISNRYTLPEAVLRALQAGADQPLWSSGGSVGPVLDHLEQAVGEGELSEDRVAEALDRVLTAKDACT